MYIEFAAVYLELRYFVPGMLRSYFPGLEDVYHIDDVLKRDVDGQALLAATRLSGASVPEWHGDVPAPSGTALSTRSTTCSLLPGVRLLPVVPRE